MPVPMAFRNGVWVNLVSAATPCYLGANAHLWKPPSAPRVHGVQFLPMTPEAIPGSHEDFQGGENTLPGGGNNYHRSTQQWADAVAQATTSTGLAPTKPDNIENNNQSEVSIFLPHRKSCSITMGLPAVKHSGCLNLGGRLQPPSED